MKDKRTHMSNFSTVNEPYECVILLEEINNLIDTLSKLTDSGYYLNYIFNSGTMVQDLLKEIGVSDDYLLETLEKFEKLRIIAFGDNIDWHGLVNYELRAIAEKEKKSKDQKEDYIRKLEYRIRQLEEEK